MNQARQDFFVRKLLQMRAWFAQFQSAGFHIANGLDQSCVAFDINANTQIRQRAKETGTRLVETNAELARSCDIILSTVTANQAAQAAKQNAPYLTARHVYPVLEAVAQVSDLR